MTQAGPPSTSNSQSWGLRAGRTLLLLVSAFLLYRWLGPQASGPFEGKPAPAFTLPVVAGGEGEITLNSLRGSPVVIEVFASWCSACRQMAPILAAASKAPRNRKVRFLAVSSDENPQLARSTQRAWGIPYPVLWDRGAFVHDYRITSLPTVILLDDKGRVRHATSGVTRASTLERWLDDLSSHPDS